MLKKIFILLSLFFICKLNTSAKEEYLQKILIDDKPLENFETTKYTYDLEFPNDKSTIKIAYEFDKEKYKVKTTGNLTTLDYGMNIIEITLTNINQAEEQVTYTLNIKRKASDENTLSSLTVGTNQVKLTDKDTYDVYVDSKLENITIKATLKDQRAKFVTGYGERLDNNQVKLNNKTTKVQIKVEAQDKSVKTYTINIIKKDYKSDDASLKSLKIDKIEYDFKSNITEYNLNVQYEIDTIKLNPVVNNSKATVNYQKDITLKEGINNILVTVTAEDGTKREYNYKITRNKEIKMIDSLKIKDIDFNFDYNTLEYVIKTNLDKLEFDLTLASGVNYHILNNENLENNSIITLEVSKDEKERKYEFKILKENEEEIKEDKKEEVKEEIKEETKKNLFLEKYEMHIGLISFGIGLFSLLIAILTRPKKSQIM